MKNFLDELENFSKASTKNESRFNKIISNYEALIKKIKEIHAELPLPGESEVVT